jgi:hypothetical protein
VIAGPLSEDRPLTGRNVVPGDLCSLVKHAGPAEYEVAGTLRTGDQAKIGQFRVRAMGV